MRAGRTGRTGAWTVRAIGAVRTIRAVVEIVDHIVVNIDIAPTPVEGSEHAGADRHPDTEGKETRRRHVAGRRDHYRRVIPGRIRPCRPIEDHRVVCGHIDDFRIGRDNFDDVILDDHLLLRAGLKVSGLHGFVAETLDGGHDIGFLREERIAEILGPVKILVHSVENVRKEDEGLDTGVPGLPVEGRLKLFSLEPAVALGPPGRLDHLEGIGGRHQDLRQK